MQYLNNDMDDLMRKAAEHYPLKPTGADWQKVALQLEVVEETTTVSKAAQTGKRYLLLFTFLLASLVCNRYKDFGLWNRGKNAASTTAIPHNRTESSGMTTGAGRDKAVVPGGKGTAAGLEKPIQKPMTSVPETEKTFLPAAMDKLDREEAQVSNKQPAAATLIQPVTSSAADRVLKDPLNENQPPNPPVVITGAPQGQSMAERPKDPTDENRKEEPSGRDKKLYAGLLVGPDISTVKLQEVKATGYNLGVVLGYRLGKRWAAETGLYWGRKNYYTEGQHFNTDKLYLPTHAEMIEADGYCHMFEIPINVRYTFAQGDKSQWFALTGLSSYLMQKEEYDYVYKRYDVLYNGSKYYKSASRDWLSVMNLSIGYERSWGRGGRVRLEPYLKLPLQGVGIGSLPLTSTGIQAGVTYPIR